MTEPKRRGRPPKPGGETPVRTARVGNVWDEAAVIAKARGENMAGVLDRLLTSYVRRHRAEAGSAPAPTSDQT
jgi:hypothetical protein